MGRNEEGRGGNRDPQNSNRDEQMHCSFQILPHRGPDERTVMKRILLLAALLSAPAFSQQTIRWSATTGDVSLSSAGTTATIQQPATNASQEVLEQVVVYCSVACSVTQAASGTAATTTAGTVTPVLPNQLSVPVPVNFFTASNVGAGTAQGGAVHIPAGGTVVLCMNTACGNSQNVTLGTSGGTGTNYSVSVSSITGTANITFYGRAVS